MRAHLRSQGVPAADGRGCRAAERDPGRVPLRRRHGRLIALLGVAIAIVASAAVAGEWRGLDGRLLEPPPLPEAFENEQRARLAEAEEARRSDPDDPDAWVWVGRRQGYLARYDEAIETFTRGWEAFPEDARFLRHRGHRLLTLRRLPEAAADFELGLRTIAGMPDRVEPDGLPNAAGVPTSTLKTNLWYHLGLVRYLLGDFPRAVEAFRSCSALAANQDMRVAAEYWLYLALTRSGRSAEASVLLDNLPTDSDLLENLDYLHLLQLFAGERTRDSLVGDARAEGGNVASATVLYGVSMHDFLAGGQEDAGRLWREIHAAPAWAAFGAIAAEAELARGQR